MLQTSIYEVAYCISQALYRVRRTKPTLLVRCLQVHDS